MSELRGKGSNLVIMKSSYGWSMYDKEFTYPDISDGLVASARDVEDLVGLAEDLEAGSVQINFAGHSA